jgi:aryl-alcohol dehydrogenase-like predicted oxidoreductase
MENRPLGKTGITVSRLGFGAWPIGGSKYGAVSEDDAAACIRAYLEAGGTFIDTARAYASSEEIIGNYFHKHGGRKDVVIASKTKCLTEAEIREELETSLKMLHTDYIDLYYLHAPPDSVEEMNRLLDVFEALKSEGKIRAVGASVKGVNVTDHTVELCRQYMNTGRIDALQVVYSIFRQKNKRMFSVAAAKGIAVIGRTVLESGFLTGKYEPGHRFPEGDHRSRWGDKQLDKIFTDAAELEKLAAAHGFSSLAEFAMKFAYDEEGIDAIIPGAKNEAQMRSNLQLIDAPTVPEAVRRRLYEEFSDRGEEFNP